MLDKVGLRSLIAFCLGAGLLLASLFTRGGYTFSQKKRLPAGQTYSR